MCRACRRPRRTGPPPLRERGREPARHRRSCSARGRPASRSPPPCARSASTGASSWSARSRSRPTSARRSPRPISWARRTRRRCGCGRRSSSPTTGWNSARASGRRGSTARRGGSCSPPAKRSPSTTSCSPPARGTGRLPVPGADLDGVVQLRTLGDAEELRQRLGSGAAGRGRRRRLHRPGIRRRRRGARRGGDGGRGHGPADGPLALARDVRLFPRRARAPGRALRVRRGRGARPRRGAGARRASKPPTAGASRPTSCWSASASCRTRSSPPRRGSPSPTGSWSTSAWRRATRRSPPSAIARAIPAASPPPAPPRRGSNPCRTPWTRRGASPPASPAGPRPTRPCPGSGATRAR